jgi:hypothetical protein
VLVYVVKKRTIVEINGRKYDTNTGQIVSETPNASPVIDGFTAPIADSNSRQKSAQPARQVNIAQGVHNKPQKTKKLHSAAVKKQVTPKKVMSKSNIAMQPALTDVQPQRQLGKQEARAQRAEQHAKSSQVQKFQAAQDQQVGEAPVAPPDDVVESPDIPPVTQPMPRLQVSQPAPQDVPAAPEPQKDSMIRRAMRARPRLVPAAITSVLVLAVGGYVAYQNIPNMALRVAAQRAGFNASLPGYSPSGFGFAGPVAYSDGVVELEYRSNSDERTYRLIQKESSWDSQSLLDNFVTANSEDYITFQERGITIYIYDTSNATWVDGGVWYTLEGNSLLNSEQLLKIASSL